MHVFSDYLRELIAKNNTTISALARQTGVERTTLSKVLAGQRVLAYSGLNAIIEQLKLMPVEEKQLRSFYEKQFQREGTLKARKIIDNMFSNLVNLDFETVAFEKRELLLGIDQYAGKQSIFSGNIKVQSLLRVVISDEMTRPDAKIEMIIPPQYSFLNDELFCRYVEENVDADITQIISFELSEKTDEAELRNLEYFCKILPYCLLSCQRYHPYYYYGDVMKHQYMDPFPYYLVTHSCVLCLSENGNYAMLLRSEDQVEYFHRHFQEQLLQCKNLVSYMVESIGVLDSYPSYIDEDKFYVIMEQPCVGCICNDKMVDEHVRQELPQREIFLAAAQRRFRLFRESKEVYTLFTESGAQRFVETGELDDIPSSLIKNIEEKTRKNLIARLANKTAEGTVKARIIRQEVFPSYLCMVISSETGITFFATQKLAERNGYFSIHLKEPSLCKEFLGWYQDLAEGSRSLNAKETEVILREIVKDCKLSGGKN